MTATFALLTIRNGVTACLMISSTALLAVSAIGPLQALVLAAAIVHGSLRRRRALPPAVWDSLAVAALLLFPLDLLVLSQHLIGAALRLLTFVVVYRCSNLNDHRDLRQAVALSFVQLLAAAASTTEVWFGIFLAAYLFMAIWTLMAMSSARDGAPAAMRRTPTAGPAASFTGLTVVAGSLLFVAIPHFGTGYFQPGLPGGSGETMTGFSDRIELGSINRIKKNRATVMRVRVHGVSDPGSLMLRWRGLALDTFDGRSWSLSRPDREWVARDADGSFHVGEPIARGRKTLDHEVTMMPLLVPVLFTAPGPARVVLDRVTALGVDRSGSLHLAQPPLARFTYRAIAPYPGQAAGHGVVPESEARRARFLSLPDIDPRVADLARSVTGGAATHFEKARRLEDYLRSTQAYSLDVNDAGVADPLTRFLVERAPGHCEYFATSLAVMLRTLEIPSRVVNGFLAGEWSPATDTFVVRQSDAHAWVEAAIPGRGWVTFDPTPVRDNAPIPTGLVARWHARVDSLEVFWDTWVVGLDLLDQQSLAASFFDAAAASLMGLTALLTALASASEALFDSAWKAIGLTVVLGGAAVLSVRGAQRAVSWTTLWRRRPEGNRLPGRSRRAARSFLAFESRWAARGIRRLPGQTPLALGKEIEERRLDRPGEALGFVRSYYRERYGP